MSLTARLTLDDVRVVGGLDDPVLRNVAITASYADFATRLDALVAPDVTWCGFGVWASRTAGRSIRGEAFGPLVDRILAEDPDYHGYLTAAMQRCRSLQRVRAGGMIRHVHVLEAVHDVTARVTDSVAEGNALVFRELGPLFVAFLEAAEGGARHDRDALVAAVERASEATSLDAASTAELQEAFECYADAVVIGDADPARRAQLVLAGNLAAVAHEQSRLQPAIETALDAAVDLGLEAVVVEAAPALLRPIVRRFVAPLLEHLGHACRRACEEVTTRALMRLVTPDEDLHLAAMPPQIDGVRYPPALEVLTDARAELQWSRWSTGTAADDWAVLHERMGFIAELFRSRQQHRALLDPPYSADQLAAVEAGRMPLPPL